MSIRSYGFNPDRSVLDGEAAVLRCAAGRVAGGESVSEVTRWMNNTGHRTPTGREWEVNTLGRTLAADRTAALLPPDVAGQLAARLAGRPKPSAHDEYLLTGGLAACGLCGAALASSKMYRNRATQPRSVRRAYACRPVNSARRSRAGCGRIRALADPLEDYVAASVLARLASPRSAAAIAAAVAREQTQRAVFEQVITESRARLGVLASEFAFGGAGAETIRPLRVALEQEIRKARAGLRRVDLLSGVPLHDQGHLAVTLPTRAVAGRDGATPRSLAEWWEQAGMKPRRALLELMIEQVRVGPAKLRGARQFDPDRVTIAWR
jgi:site-specific DNA recombinase